VIAARYRPGIGLEVTEAPVPAVSEDELLVRVEATSICGTDLKIISCGHRKLAQGQAIILGHEFAGVVEIVGRHVLGFRSGMRVGIAPNIGCGQCEMCAMGMMNMCPSYSAFGIDRDGSHAEFVKIPASAIAQGNVVRLPECISMVEASLAEPLSCVVNASRVTGVNIGDTVLVYGAGAMGLLNLMVMLISGAAQVFVVDLNETRLEKALQLGASAVLNPKDEPVSDWVLRNTSGRGVDVAIVAVPNPDLQKQAVELLAPYGRLCLFAGVNASHSQVHLDTNAIHYKSLVVTGMTGGAVRDYRTALKLIESRRIDVKKVVSHVFPLKQVERAYDIAKSGSGLKVVMVNSNDLFESQ